MEVLSLKKEFVELIEDSRKPLEDACLQNVSRVS